MIKNSTALIICLLAAVFVAGCGMSRRNAIQKKTFLLKVEHPQHQVSNPLPACFDIRIARVAPAFSGTQIVYRTGPVSFEQDYYNTYLSPPNEQFEDIVERWFRNSDRFICHTSQQPDVKTFTLESHLDELYADFQDEANPAGVAQMHFYLSWYDEECSCPIEMLKKTYTARTPLTAKPSPEKVVQALSQSITQILTEVEADIAKAIEP